MEGTLRASKGNVQHILHVGACCGEAGHMPCCYNVCSIVQPKIAQSESTNETIRQHRSLQVERESCFVSCVRDTALLISSNSQNFGSTKIWAPSARHSVAASVMSVSGHWPLTSHCGVVRFRDLTSIRGPSKSAQASASPTEHRACGRKCFEPPRHCLGASPGMLDWTF